LAADFIAATTLIYAFIAGNTRVSSKATRGGKKGALIN
jgi:hypothetical protein